MALEILRKHDPERPAIVGEGFAISYGELCARVAHVASSLRALPGQPLIFLFSDDSADALIVYLACLESRLPVALFDGESGNPSLELTSRYGNPHLILGAGASAPRAYESCEMLQGSSLRLATRRSDAEYATAIHPDLALLLQTSGSTGSPKLVRLSRSAVIENACAIASYLGIDSSHRSIQSLPMSYSFGLSLVNSHLFAGATVALTRHSFLRPEFWSDFDRYSCSSFAGVPFMYESLERLRFHPRNHPSLRIMTQAGGGLRPDLARSFARKCREANAKFFVMYGQTEATARIAFVPPERLEDKIGAIGVPIPGGRLELCEVAGMPGRKELVFCGPSVMMGYAEGAESLCLGDELGGRLATGDLARVDAEGFYFLEGRIKRIAKLYGLRIQLEDIERRVEEKFSVRAAALDVGECVRVFLESEGQNCADVVRADLAAWLQLPPKAFEIQLIDALPRNPAGKMDYARLVAS